MFHTCNDCGQRISRIGYQCGCGNTWHRDHFASQGLNPMDFMFEMEEIQDIEQGNFGGAMEVVAEQEFFDGDFF